MAPPSVRSPPLYQRAGAIEKALERFSVSDKIDSVVNELSSGEKQRVAMARAMLKPGSLILADEPTGSLDARMAETVMDSLVSASRESGKTLVVVTHDMSMAAKCDRTLRMSGGSWPEAGLLAAAPAPNQHGDNSSQTPPKGGAHNKKQASQTS